MHISETGLELIKRFESLRLRSYRDGGGVLTIGWGSTRNVKPNMVIDTNQATIRLLDDVEIAEKAVRKLIKVALNQNQFDAMVSFLFNLGEPQVSTSTLLRRLNEGRYSEAADQFTRWRYDNGKEVKGLLNRRIAERELFLRKQDLA